MNSRFADGLPQDWMSESNQKLSNKYFKLHQSMRERIFKEHVTTLCKLERKSIKKGTHPSLSHEREEEARKIAAELAEELIMHGLEFVHEVKIMLYHSDRIISLIFIDDNVVQSEAEEKLPLLYHAFETRCTQRTN